MDVVNVVLADDHPAFLVGIRNLLVPITKVQIVAEVSTPERLLAVARHFTPDLIISDVSLASRSVAQAIYDIKKCDPSGKVLIISDLETEEEILQLLGAGVDGYARKKDTPEILSLAIQAVLQGGVWLSPMLVKLIIGSIRSPSPHNVSCCQKVFQVLSKREQEILELVAAGMENYEIADTLCITKRTVQNHVSTLYQKLNVKSRSQAVLLALKQGLVK